jgi:hypothetical protein
MKFFGTFFGKFLILIGVFAVFECWIYANAPPLPTKHICYEERERLSGAGFVLTQAQADPVPYTDLPADIARFNRMVDAYNQSCGGERRVSRSNLARDEVIRGEVNANRNALWAEGIARFPGAARRIAGR